MDTRIQLVAIVATAGLFVIVFELVRRRRLMERYALLWLFASVTLLALAVWKDLLEQVAAAVGIYYAPSALFAIAFGFVLVLLHALLAGHLAAVGPEQGARAAARAAAARGRRRCGRARTEPMSSAPPGTTTSSCTPVAEHGRPGGRGRHRHLRERGGDPRDRCARSRRSSPTATSSSSSTTRRATAAPPPRAPPRPARPCSSWPATAASRRAASPAPQRAARRCCSSSTRTPCSPRAALDALRAAAGEHPRWGAWQALVLLPGGERVNTSGGVVHWLGIAWAGEFDASAPAARPAARGRRSPPGAALVVRRERVGRGRRLRSGLVHVRARTSTSPCACGSRAGASASCRPRGWSTTTTSPRATTSGSTSSATAGGRCSRAYPGAAAGARRARAARVRASRCSPSPRSGGWLPAKLRAQARRAAQPAAACCARRRAVQATRTITPGAFADWLTPALDSPFLGGPAKLAAVRWLVTAYWRAIRLLLPA